MSRHSLASRRSLLSVLVCAFALASGCEKKEGGASGGGGASSSGRLRIAVIPKGTTHVFWQSVERGAKQAGKDLDVEVIWKGPLKEDDRGMQIGVVESFASEGVSGIVLAPLDASAMLTPVQAARAKNIPVVIFDSPLNGELGKDFVSLVATDNKKGGYMAGEELAKRLEGKGKVVLLRYAVGSASTEQREAGFLEALSKHPEIRLIEQSRYAGATVGEAQKVSENMLDKLREADGIFCANESSTHGMLNVLVDNDLAGKKKFVGFDTSETLLAALDAGHIHGLVAQNPTHMGYTAVKTMVSHIKGEKVDGYVDTGCAMVTKESINTAEVKKILGRE